ncbi:uncharacterized protein LOC119872360 isoform X1 [Canis lupus familiaris]|uniref:uncharacterized protein LOC119872360 isoform X1 n=1 Tax=Canis lupus familiaris TaxID=9615 RepID=UPI0018F75762|nr:uncharacterized protein LOC119872360 isoform X1 [Canis lupus familiaris]XP_038394840.1 uncharacterized protein LOC119872360 isoform X1 [Canis lupus familiaris]XP_038523671.1 uncharacterized protein LOC119872360 isoform X1 [Canis lupus familiaris]
MTQPLTGQRSGFKASVAVGAHTGDVWGKLKGRKKNVHYTWLHLIFKAESNEDVLLHVLSLSSAALLRHFPRMTSGVPRRV